MMLGLGPARRLLLRGQALAQGPWKPGAPRSRRAALSDAPFFVVRSSAHAMGRVSHTQKFAIMQRRSMGQSALSYASFGHVNMYPWKHLPVDVENGEILSIS